MSATTLISAGSAPFSGTYKPDGNFAALTGNANGTWLLKVRDMAGVDIGNILNWSITINKAIPGTYSYMWSSTPPGFSSTINNPVVNPVVSTTYEVIVTEDGTGCIGTQSLPVTVAAMNTYFADSDGDGYGENGNSQQLCSPSGIYLVTAGGDCNDNNVNIHPGAVEACNLVDDNCNSQIDEGCNSITLNLKIFIDGFYKGSREMESVLFNSLVTGNQSVCDTIVIELYESFPPYLKKASVKTMLYTNGNATAVFPSTIQNSSYYIAVKHRNANETWSKNPVLFDTVIESFDFTTP